MVHAPHNGRHPHQRLHKAISLLHWSRWIGPLCYYMALETMESRCWWWATCGTVGFRVKCGSTQRGSGNSRALQGSTCSNQESMLWWHGLDHLSHLSDECEEVVGSPVTEEVQDEQRLLPRLHWVPMSHPQLTVPNLASPFNIASRWAQSMSASLSHPSSRASSAAWHSCNSGECNFHMHSASPNCHQIGSNKYLPEGQAVYIEELHHFGSQYAGRTSPWASKKLLSWNPDYLEAGYLLVPDKRAQAHLCFWAACSQEAYASIAF